MPLQRLDRFRVDIASGNTSGTPCSIPAMAELIDQCFTHHGAARIPRAQHQHVEHIQLHQPQHPAVLSDGSQQSCFPIASGVQQALSV